jgi:hypothetical protein
VALKSYNIAMNAAAPKRQLGKRSSKHHSVPHIYTTETTGLLIIALLILIVTLARYWHFMRWSLR